MSWHTEDDGETSDDESILKRPTPEALAWVREHIVIEGTDAQNHRFREVTGQHHIIPPA